MLDFIVDDSINYLVIDDFYELDTFMRNRKTKDVNLNSFGQTLINLCKSFNIHVLNGRTKGDSPGELTCISKTGCSQIDYSIVSSELFDLGVDVCILSHDIELVDSDHLPTVSTFYCQKLTTKYVEDISVQSQAKIIWKSDEQETFTTKLNNDQLCKTYFKNTKLISKIY